MIKYLLYTKCNINFLHKPYLYSNRKKPYFKDCEYCFNISHSGRYIVCIVDKNDIGIDIEDISRLNMESDQIKKYDDVKLWTIKESIAKFADISLMVLLYPIKLEKCLNRFLPIKTISFTYKYKFYCTICTYINNEVRYLEIKKYSEYIEELKDMFNINLV